MLLDLLMFFSHPSWGQHRSSCSQPHVWCPPSHTFLHMFLCLLASQLNATLFQVNLTTSIRCARTPPQPPLPDPQKTIFVLKELPN